jgi:L-ascorbate metabolism protein UlaG (beta-lactamase superfamily)
MIITFLGHAAFLITSESGVKIVTDPYKPGCFNGGIQYSAITDTVDIVTISHEHDDHNDSTLKGKPKYVRGPGTQEIKGITVTGTEVFHDTSQGQERGKNTIFNILVDSVNIVHLGDLGHKLSYSDSAKIGKVDVLLIPVGGYFTIDAAAAWDVVKMLKPKIVIPMHYKTAKCGFPIAPVDDFVKGKEAKKIDGELEITRSTLPESTTVYVLKPSK